MENDCLGDFAQINEAFQRNKGVINRHGKAGICIDLLRCSRGRTFDLADQTGDWLKGKVVVVNGQRQRRKKE